MSFKKEGKQFFDSLQNACEKRWSGGGTSQVLNITNDDWKN